MNSHYQKVLVAVSAAVLLTSVSAWASETDDRIEASAKQSYVFKTYLTNDAIKNRVQGWGCHLDRNCQ